MKKIAFIVLLFVIAPVCFAKNNDKDVGGNTPQSSKPVSDGLDLANLTFKENIQSIYKVAGVDAVSSEEKTLFGYERSESSSPNLLNYNGVSLSGEFEEKKNKIVFHYSEVEEILSMYELRIYSRSQSSGLVGEIQEKMGLPLVTKLSTDNENGISFKQAVWAKGDVIYFILQELDASGVKTSNLAVFENSNKDFYKLLGQKGYAIDPSSLIEEALRRR